jgi:hypothetical protein
MVTSVMVRPMPTTRGERLPVAMAMPIIQIATSRHRSGSIQSILADFLPVYIIYIPRPRERKLKKYSTAGQDTLRLQTILKIISGKIITFSE